MRYSRTTFVLILVGALLWCAGIIGAPLCLSSSDGSAIEGKLLYQIYRPICHQLPERSFFLEGFPFGVCERCSAIYFAFLFGTILYPLFRPLSNRKLPPRWLLLVAAVPMLIDATWIGPLIYNITPGTRAFTGGLFGLILPFFLLPIAIESTAVWSHQLKGFSDAQ
jgi:uncharacterized membrane protein